MVHCRLHQRKGSQRQRSEDLERCACISSIATVTALAAVLHSVTDNSTRQFLDSVGLTHYEEGDLGPIYG